MKKSKMLIAVFAVMAAASAAGAEGVAVDFDNTGGIRFNAYISENMGIENVEMGQIGVNKQEDISVSKSEAKVPAMAEVLGAVSIENRLKFLNSLVLRNGRIIYADVARLKASAGQSAVIEILKAPYRNTAPGVDAEPGIPARVVQMSALLSEVPAEIRQEFLEGMSFIDGRFVSAYVGGLRKALGDVKLKKILSSIVTAPNKSSRIEGTKAYCPDGLCYNAYCAYVWQNPKCLSTDSDNVCDSACSE